MSLPEKNQVLGFKTLRADDWGTGLAKHQKKFHEHTRRRGFTPEEIAIFKSRGRWKNGEYVETVPQVDAA